MGSQNPKERFSSLQRREQILAAASRVFGERGYIGATTDQVAQAAGISQPYVVRLFGGKEQLFLAVLDRALDALFGAFRRAIAEGTTAGEDADGIARRVGAAYADLIADRGILLSLMQGFILGHDPVIGPRARAGFRAIYDLMRDEAGLDAERTTRFLADGMLFNTLLALRIPDEYGTDERFDEIVECTYRAKLGIVLAAVGARDAAREGDEAASGAVAGVPGPRR